MQETLALIGPSDSVNVMCTSIERFFPKIAFKAYICEKTEDTYEILEQSQRECDGLLFSGIGVQETFKKRVSLLKPFAYIERGAYSLLRVLAEIQRKGLPLERISIDVVTQSVLSEVLREFGTSFGHVHSMPFDPKRQEQEYFNWHTHLLQTGRVDFAVSGFGSVYHELIQAGYPAFRMLPSTLQVRETTNRLLADIAAYGLRSAGIAIQIIRLERNEAHPVNQYDRMRDEGRFFLELLDYARAIQGSLFPLGKREYTLFSTRGVIENPIHLQMFRQLIDWGRANNIRVISGIGIGVTAFDAEKAAQKGLAHSQKRLDGGVFLARGKHVHGPLGDPEALEYRTRVHDGPALHMAKKIGISPSYLERIRALMEKTGKHTFDSTELAACLGIGERSARRILQKFLENGHARVVGKEKAHPMGRPKNLIEIRI